MTVEKRLRQTPHETGVARLPCCGPAREGVLSGGFARAPARYASSGGRHSQSSINHSNQEPTRPLLALEGKSP